MSFVGTQKTCYDKLTSNEDILHRQNCMYAANGEMVCNFKGDAVTMILGDKCTVGPHGGKPGVSSSSGVVSSGGCTACGAAAQGGRL